MPQTLGVDPGTGINGTGTTLAGGISGPIGMITKIGIEGQEADEIDVTTMNAVGKWKKFIAGLKDGKGMTLDLVYERVNMTTLAAAFGVADTYTIVLPEGSTFVSDGFLKKIGTAIPNGDKVTQSVMFRLSGPMTFHAASGA